MNSWIANYPNAESFFKNLSREDFQQLKIITLRTGEVLMEQHSLDDNALYYILSGICEGRRLHTEHVAEGMYYVPIKVKKDSFVGFTEATKINPTRRTIGIYAKTKLDVIKIPKALVFKWLKNNQDFFLSILARILDTTWQHREIITTCNKQNAGIRLSYHLLYLYKIYQESCYNKEYDGSVRIMDTRIEISQAVGCSTRTVDRSIYMLKDKNLLTLKSGKIQIDKQQYNALCMLVEVET